jgi:phosphatidylserine/phosphatidylglycerophosphate/cardiolipin synthase-like enzyme
LKDRIVAALEAAGTSGVRVKELAQELGTKPVNVHSWFHSAMKRYAAIKKLAGGHYRLDGRIESSSPSARSAAARNQTKARATSTTTRAKSTRAAKKPTGPSKRGELSARILSEMQQAGARGINVRELAETLGANYKNIYIWFATTGKKNPNIRKLGKAQYRLES